MSNTSCRRRSGSLSSREAFAERRSPPERSSMPNAAARAFREKYGALEQRLAGQGAIRELDTLKSEIGALFKELETEITELSSLRDDVKQLVDRWKALRAQNGGNGSTGTSGQHGPV